MNEANNDDVVKPRSSLTATKFKDEYFLVAESEFNKEISNLAIL